MPAWNDVLKNYLQIKSFPQLQKLTQDFEKTSTTNPDPKNLKEVKVAILSNFSTPFICSSLKIDLLQYGFWPEVYEEEYDQWEISALNPKSSLFDFNPEITLLLLSSLPLYYQGDSRPKSVVDRILECIKNLKKNSSSKIILTLPEPLSDETHTLTGSYEWRFEVKELLKKNGPPDVVLLDLEPLIRKKGRHWYADRFYVSSKLAFHPNYTKDYVHLLSATLADFLRPHIKLVIADLDNTLWGGIVGEDGTQGVDLNYQEKGLAHLKLQKFLKYLQKRGIILAICSKNNHNDAIDVFKQRPEMILKESDFSAIRINWDPKSKNIESILDELKLSKTGIVFLDDSPFEREEVRNQIPELIVPELESDPLEWAESLLETGLFHRSLLTEEDKKRSKLYALEGLRQSGRSQFKDEKEFLKSLELVLKVRDFKNCAGRVIDLLGKTNQFNLTTKRHHLNDLETFLKNKGQIFVFELEDRFGSYGVISVVITIPQDNKTALLDTWLMSCRVIARKVENAVFSYVIHNLQKEGFTKLEGEYVPTKKNKLVSQLLPQLGFKETSPNRYEINLDKIRASSQEHFCKIVELLK